MNLFKAVVCGAIVSIPAAALAQPMNNPCSDIKWNAKFLEMYPRAAVACQTVEVKNGVRYAKFVGRVTKVNADSMELEVHNVAGTAVGTSLWHTTPDETLSIGGREAKAKDLKKGDELTFWVAEGSAEMAPKPGAKPIVTPQK